MENLAIQTEGLIINSSQLLNHWQGHRRLTRRVIDAFPEDKLFSWSIGGMRTFSELVMEMINMTAPGVVGMATGDWNAGEIKNTGAPKTKKELLALWDDVTEKINEVFPKIPIERFQVKEAAFGRYEGVLYSTLFYIIDNEIHHRGQGTVYLRSLGIEPPAFWFRD